MIVAFTGHRPDKIGGYTDLHRRKEIKRWLTNLLSHYKAQDPELRAISGMALGVDQWAAEVCIDLGIPFTAAWSTKRSTLRSSSCLKSARRF